MPLEHEGGAIALSLIAAVAENGVVGRDNQLPWRLSSDLQYFKAQTLGKPVVMGRKTYDSIGRPLPGRPNIVISRNAEFTPEGVTVAADIPAALALAAQLAAEQGADEVMVIGGSAIYAATLAHADRLYLTEVHAAVDGDAHFPELDLQDWRELRRERHPADERNEHDHSFVLYQRNPHH